MNVRLSRIIPTSLNSTTLWACSLGTILEWYDFFIFAILAPTISVHFFPAEHKGSAMLLTFIAFATSFISRPIGGLIFGYIGDRFGRKPSLLLSLFLMGASSTAIAVIPSYATWGMTSSIIIFIIRFLQGLALGGEYAGAATYVAEQAEPSTRATQTSYLQMTSSFGFIFALGVVVGLELWLGQTSFNAWGWRIAFLLSLSWIVPSYFIRRKLTETDFFKHIKQSKAIVANPIKALFQDKRYFRALLVSVFGLTMGQAISSYSGFYSMYFIQAYPSMTKMEADKALLISTFFALPLKLIAGRWADKTSYKHVILWGLFVCIVTYIPIFKGLAYFLERPTVAGAPVDMTIFVGVIVLLFLQSIGFSLVYAPLIAQLTVLFPTQLRYTGISLSYNIGTGIFGGTFLAIVNYLAISPLFISGFYDSMLYPMILMSISLVIGYRFLPKKDLFPPTASERL